MVANTRVSGHSFTEMQVPFWNYVTEGEAFLRAKHKDTTVILCEVSEPILEIPRVSHHQKNTFG